ADFQGAGQRADRDDFPGRVEDQPHVRHRRCACRRGCDKPAPRVLRVRIAIVGVGKMGKTIRDLALAQKHEIAAELDIGQLTQDAVRKADVAIEFTQPDAAVDNLLKLAAWKIPTVCGTTGWYPRLSEVKAAVDKGKS